MYVTTSRRTLYAPGTYPPFGLSDETVNRLPSSRKVTSVEMMPNKTLWSFQHRAANTHAYTVAKVSPIRPPSTRLKFSSNASSVAAIDHRAYVTTGTSQFLGHVDERNKNPTPTQISRGKTYTSLASRTPLNQPSTLLRMLLTMPPMTSTGAPFYSKNTPEPFR